MKQLVTSRIKILVYKPMKHLAPKAKLKDKAAKKKERGRQHTPRTLAGDPSTLVAVVVAMMTALVVVVVVSGEDLKALRDGEKREKKGRKERTL